MSGVATNNWSTDFESTWRCFNQLYFESLPYFVDRVLNLYGRGPCLPRRRGDVTRGATISLLLAARTAEDPTGWLMGGSTAGLATMSKKDFIVTLFFFSFSWEEEDPVDGFFRLRGILHTSLRSVFWSCYDTTTQQHTPAQLVDVSGKGPRPKIYPGLATELTAQ
jgi:hypothetical protein